MDTPEALYHVPVIHGLLWTAAARWPAAAAVRDRHGVWTYQELRHQSARFAAWLVAEGVTPGMRVVVRATSVRETVATLYGCSLAGAVAVPISPAMRAFQLRTVIADADPTLVVGDDAECARAAAGRHVWAPTAGWPGLPEQLPAAGGRGSELAYLLYTSGSTGQPKAVSAPHRAVLFAAAAVQRALRYRRTDVVFCRIPLSFDYGLYQTLLCALAGAQLTLAAADRDITLLTDLRAAGATIVPVVPALAKMLAMLARRDHARTAIRMFTNTGEALPAAVIAELRRRFPAAGWHLMYGTTECKRTSIMERDADLGRPGSVGRPLPGTQVRIVDDAGDPVPPHTTGEIVVRGPHVMAGYWRAPELTAGRFRGDELRTGDFGYLDGDGYLYLVGRRDSIFKQGGLRVSAAEIEAAAADVPGVRDAAVLPPVGGRGAVLCLVATVPVAEVLNGLQERLEPARIPRIRLSFDRFPLTETQKVDRRRLTAVVEERLNGL